MTLITMIEDDEESANIIKISAISVPSNR